MLNNKWLAINCLVAIVLSIVLYNNRTQADNVVINDDLLNIDEIAFIDVNNFDGPSRIRNKEDIKNIISLIQQMNGPIEYENLTHLKDPQFGLHIALKGHYPSSAIMFNKQTMYFGKGKSITQEQYQQLKTAIENRLIVNEE